MRCICGYVIIGNSPFCPQCGRPTGQTAQNVRNSKNNIVEGAIYTAFLFFGFIFAFFPWLRQGYFSAKPFGHNLSVNGDGGAGVTLILLLISLIAASVFSFIGYSKARFISLCAAMTFVILTLIAMLMSMDGGTPAEAFWVNLITEGICLSPVPQMIAKKLVAGLSNNGFGYGNTYQPESVQQNAYVPQNAYVSQTESVPQAVNNSEPVFIFQKDMACINVVYQNKAILDSPIYLRQSAVVVSNAQKGIENIFWNMSAKIISEIQMDVIGYDMSGVETEEITQFAYKGINFMPNTNWGQGGCILLNNSNTVTYKIKVNSVTFSDGSMWNNMGAIWS